MKTVSRTGINIKKARKTIPEEDTGQPEDRRRQAVGPLIARRIEVLSGVVFGLDQRRQRRLEYCDGSRQVNAVEDAPVADAGFDEIVVAGSTVSLDGSASSDIEGDPLTFSWTFVAMPEESTAVLSDPGADFNKDSAVNTLDLNIYTGLHRLPPRTVVLRRLRHWTLISSDE